MGENRFVFQDALKKGNAHYVFKYMDAERYINRPLAGLIIKALYNTRVTPNQLTLTAFLISLPGIVLIALGGHLNAALGGILVYLSCVIDAADGMLARSRGNSSEYGKYLDLFLDRVSDFLICMAVAIHLLRVTGNKGWLTLGSIVMSLYMLQIVLFYIKNLYLKRDTGRSGDARGLIGFLLLIFALFNRLDLFLLFSTVEVAVVVPYRIIDFLLLGKKKRG